MLKKEIKYTDLDGNEVTEEFHFHLSKAELAQMALEEDDISTRLKTLAEGGDRKEIIAAFNFIIEKSFGRRSEDGKRFVKDVEEARAFMQSEAYGELFMELFTDPVAAVDFIKATIPGDLAEKLAGQFPDMTTVQLPAGPDAGGTNVTTDLRSAKTFDDYTDEELLEMSQEEFDQLLRRLKGNNVPKRILLINRKRHNEQ